MSIHIITLSQLQAMKDDLTEDYILDNDIDATATSGWNDGKGFEPVGRWVETEDDIILYCPDHTYWTYQPFTGSFDGQGYTISNLFMDWSEADCPNAHSVGLFGNTDGATISNVKLVDCNIKGDYRVGALAGRAANSTIISSCSSTGIVYATSDDVGGLLGHAYNNVEITDCYSEAVVTASDEGAGGLVGRASTGCLISNCYATGEVTANSSGDAGGLLSSLRNSTVSNCYATGNVATIDDQHAGGLIGYTTLTNTISQCYATGNVSAYAEAGGLIGDTGGITTISQCYATGNVTVTDEEAGGFLGLGDSDDIISNCYATGNVIGDDSVGGFCGENDGAISNCYSIGTVTGNSQVGGFCGNNDGTISNCFWDTEISGQATSDGGTGKTTEEMQTKSTFTDADWNFVTIWNICEAPDYIITYPWLRWENIECVASSSSTGLLCNDKTNPTALETSTPYFSAIYNDYSTTNVAQYYQLQVNTTSDFTGDELWDSGKISMGNVSESERCSNISYGGSSLVKGTAYYWRIKFWNDENSEGAWSSAANFAITWAETTRPNPSWTDESKPNPSWSSSSEPSPGWSDPSVPSPDWTDTPKDDPDWEEVDKP